MFNFSSNRTYCLRSSCVFSYNNQIIYHKDMPRGNMSCLKDRCLTCTDIYKLKKFEMGKEKTFVEGHDKVEVVDN